MQYDLMKKTAIWGTIFSIAAMSAIIYMAYHKVVTITNVAQDEVQGKQARQEDGSKDQEGSHLTFETGDTNTSYLRIPLPAGSKAENITIENHYMDRQLWIIVNHAKRTFYAEHVISGNKEYVEQGVYEKSERGVVLKLGLTGVYECYNILENDNLYISFQSPKETYNKIIVIDPAAGGSDTGLSINEMEEKEIALEIAKKLKEKLDESEIKAYYTRMDDVNPSEEERIQLANATKADMYIRIQVSADKNTGIYGTTALYNGDYFIPGFGSIELADILEREVVTAVKGKALGLEEAGVEHYAIRHATIPAAAVCVGYLSNPQEAILLQKDAYTDKIATGIYNAILKVYSEKQW